MSKRIFHTIIFCLFNLVGFAQTQWPSVTQASKPWTRWWWMGSAADNKNITSLLGTYAKAGIGGVEIVPIYGAKGVESRYVAYLSPQWMQLLDTTVAVAKKCNMGVDVAVGTGWPIGGPQVSTNDAATKIIIQQYKLSAGQSLSEKIIISDPKQQRIDGVRLDALMAYGKDGTVMDITAKVTADATLQWIPEKGEWDIYAAFTAKTLQKVKRAAPGGEGYTFDHFSTLALGNYFKRFDTAYGNSSHGVRSFFNDSYEVFNANWSPDFFLEFKNRRGYDLKKYLREFNGNDNTKLTAAVKSDYRETMADLMLDNFSAKFSSWAHSKNALSTNQAHGSPGNLLDLYAAVDIAETETFGSTYFPIPGLRRDSADIRNVDPDPIMSKFASSAAHAIGHRYTSSETFTWLTEHFKTSWSQCKPEVDNLFLAGVNHVFFHGTTYSPADATWPGWLFYASVNFVPANSLWPQLNGLTQYISHCQAVLQAGKPANDLMIYWPIYDIWSEPKGKDKPLKVHDIDNWLQPSAFYKDIKKLQQQGYTIDAVSDKMIAQAFYKNDQIQVTDSGAAYKILVVPQCKIMPLATLKKLYQLAGNGASIIFQSLPLSPQGLDEDGTKAKVFDQFIAGLSFVTVKDGIKEMRIGKGRIFISQNIETALNQVDVQPEALVAVGLQYICRKVEDGRFYFIVNHTAKNVDTFIHLQASATSFVLMDPLTGKEGSVKPVVRSGKKYIRLQVASGVSVIVKTINRQISLPAWNYSEEKGMPLFINNKWTVTFSNGGPSIPQSRKIAALSSWTTWGDTSLQNFSGTATYAASFVLKSKTADDYKLQLGKVCESAKVFINGHEAGIAWSLPFELNVGKYLQAGKNEIRIEVVNLMANRIRYMDRNKIPWRNYNEINFVNINYKDFDASAWQLQPSGMLGPVILQPIKFER